MTAVDKREFARFMLSGGLSTLANIAAVWAARPALSFDAALLLGMAVGIVSSFALSKLFAFRARSWRGTPGELARFALVYGVGLLLYWRMAVAGEHALGGYAPEAWQAETGGVLIGAMAMVVTSYLGHRFFTYGSHRAAA